MIIRRCCQFIHFSAFNEFLHIFFISYSFLLSNLIHFHSLALSLFVSWLEYSPIFCMVFLSYHHDGFVLAIVFRCLFCHLSQQNRKVHNLASSLVAPVFFVSNINVYLASSPFVSLFMFLLFFFSAPLFPLSTHIVHHANMTMSLSSQHLSTVDMCIVWCTITNTTFVIISVIFFCRSLFFSFVHNLHMTNTFFL